MPKPQQPELHRSGLGSTDRDGAELRAAEAEQTLGGDKGMGPAPEENQPGHRPAQDEDKPQRDSGTRAAG